MRRVLGEATVPRIDTQVVELLGRNRLVSELLRAGLEVAVPARDRGIDLIAYADLSAEVKQFVARPIQMKAASQSSFSINRKFERVADLIIAYVWHLEDPSKAVTYALTWKEVLQVATARGFTRTNSWMKGSFVVNRPGAELRKLLLPFEMTPAKWHAKIVGHRADTS
jgi:hypothetical protein